tara:strand:- start:104 stop:1231 length:1128 start_codon:yes stop_codon:yes gene_type:complete
MLPMKTPTHAAGWHDPTLATSYLDNLPDPIVVLDREGVVFEGNAAFFAFVAISRDVLLNQSILSVLQEAPSLDGLLECVLAMAQRGVDDSIRLTMAEGTDGPRTMLLTATSFVGVNAIPCVALRMEDVSERTSVAEQKAETLERLNQELEGFSYSVAHDLRAPLRFIDKIAYLLIERHSHELSSEALQLAEQIREGSRQTACLVEDLLEFSKVTSLDLRREEVDMTGVAREVVETTRLELDGRDLTIELSDLGVALGDPVLIRQVFANLIGNGAKFTRPRGHGEIRIGREDSSGVARFTVEDNGVGFDMDRADKLFGVFQRFHQPEDFEGSGVGLAVVKRIVNRHGGEVWAESAVGTGARFSFTLAPIPSQQGEA